MYIAKYGRLQLININISKVRVRRKKGRKKRACPARVAEAGQGNIETVHEPKPIQAAATPWGQGRRAMGDFHGPQTQVHEGIYAIKVSMSCSLVPSSIIYQADVRTDQALSLTMCRSFDHNGLTSHLLLMYNAMINSGINHIWTHISLYFSYLL